MTLILSFATPYYVMQVSDRRITDVESAATISSRFNKMVLFNGRMAYSFTGMAHIGDNPTDNWLTEKLLELPADVSLCDTARHIANEASRIIPGQVRYASEQKHLAFVGVGWEGKLDDLRPQIHEISNFHDLYHQRVHPRPHFSVRVNWYAPGGWGWVENGLKLNPSERAWLVRYLDKCADCGAGPNSIARLLAHTIRRVATRSNLVSRDLMVCVIPKAAVRSDAPAISQSGIMLGPNLSADGMLQFPHPNQSMVFRYLSETDEVVDFAPNFVRPGEVAIRGFTFNK